MSNNEIGKLLICSIKKVDNGWVLYDCNGENISNLSGKFPSSMNLRYRKKRGNKWGKDVENSSCVWVLIGKINEAEKWIQVGRNSSLKNMLSNDIKEDIKQVYSGTGKYGGLNYSELIFYEINIKNYIENDEKSKGILGTEPLDNNLKRAFWVNCAAYIEGKLASEKNVQLYHLSVLDGCYYAYFESKKNA